MQKYFILEVLYYEEIKKTPCIKEWYRGWKYILVLNFRTSRTNTRKTRGNEKNWRAPDFPSKTRARACFSASFPQTRAKLALARISRLFQN